MVIHYVCHNQLKKNSLCFYSFYKMINKVTASKNVPLRSGMIELQYNLHYAVQEKIEHTVISELATVRLKNLCRALNTRI